MTLIQKAVNKTRIFLDNNINNSEKYQPNEVLSNLWLDAFEAILRFDFDLAMGLRQKSNFWADPQEIFWRINKFLRLNGSQLTILQIDRSVKKLTMTYLKLYRT